MKSSHFLTALGSLALNSAFGQGFMSGDSAVTDELSQKSSIQMVAGKTYDPALASYYQRFVDGIPLHGARVVAESGGNDFLIPGLDQFADPATFDSTYPAISKELAATVAEANAEFPVDSEVNVVWFQTNTHAKLCWEVVTTLADSGEPVSPTHMEAIVDGQTGELLSQRQIDINNYDPSDSTQTEWGIFPRIVVNNAMGISGGRSYGAAFDAVVSVGGGCTGTLIAPNVVLCARHCGAGPGSQIVFGDNLNGGGLVFRTVQSSFLPDGGGSLLDGGDVSILTLSSPVPASVAVPMRLIDETNELEGMRCATVGYGLNGLGSSGHNFSSDGYRWGGENIIDRYGSPASGGGGSNIISTDFDNGSNGANSIGGSSPNPLQYEATTAGGDSGGPVLVELGGEWVIAGVLSGGTTSTSTYGDVSWWTGTAVYRTAIESRGGEFGIPAPGACCFANGSCVSVFNDECDSAGGSFEGASTNCAPSPCPPPSIGACCFGSQCSDLTPLGCANGGGVFIGLGSECVDNNCTSRACCLGSGGCVVLSPNVCSSIGGTSDAVDCASSSCAPPACPEDLNDNGSVDFQDLLEVLGSWGGCGSCEEDFDDDGFVGFDDLLNLLSKWGPC